MASRQRQIELLARLFKILGDPTRLKITVEMLKGELNVTQICRKLKMSQPTVSRHLGLLRMSDLVATRRNGKEIFYSLPPKILRALKALLQRGEAMIK
ncbi:MAG: winged helix-turn-helix transcriptional regulator [Phycisphaerae bacterium]|nr:winged helix-turn-helix transcriptional regulator [Phycisphaerae bacterium]